MSKYNVNGTRVRELSFTGLTGHQKYLCEAFYFCFRILSRNSATNASNDIGMTAVFLSFETRKQLTFREIAPIKLIIFRRFSSQNSELCSWKG